MIRINLLGEKEDRRGIYLVQGTAFASMMIAAVCLCFMTHTQIANQLEDTQTERSLLSRRMIALREKTKRVEGLETKKKLLRQKLTTIAMLKAKKHGPVQVLDAINLSIPEKAWLTSIQEKIGGILEINGLAIDHQTVSQFMAEMKKSKFFAEIDLPISKDFAYEDAHLKQFTITVQLKNFLEVGIGTATDQKKT
jgi:Tfp pilus assembly protein PilN